MQLPYGTGHLKVDLSAYETTVATPPPIEPVDVRTAAEAALDSPHGPSLRSLAADAETVAIVVTDVTRDTPDDVLLDALLARLSVPRERITVVLGLGLHRPMTDAEIREGLGEHADLAVNHDPTATVTVGELPVESFADGDGEAGESEPAARGSIPIEVHPAVASADLVLATGMVEPHQYAGFSGGAKTVVIGAGSESIIRYTHGPDLLSSPDVRLGRIEDNPFRETLDRAGDLAGPDFCINVAGTAEGVVGVSAGRPRAVVEELAAVGLEAVAAPVEGTFDAAITCIPAPKDANLYQASRAATYCCLGPHNPVRAGGRVVVPARIPEGAGEGTGERRFHEWLRSATSPEALYEEMRQGYEAGAQRAFVLARALRRNPIHVTNSDRPEVVEECLMTAHDDVVDALEPGSRVLVVPDGVHTLLTPA